MDLLKRNDFMTNTIKQLQAESAENAPQVKNLTLSLEPKKSQFEQRDLPVSNNERE